MAQLNNRCRVKLTEKGKEIIAHENKEVKGLYTYDKDGYFECPLWEMMSLFGKYMYHGGDNPFDMEIELSEYK